MAKLGSMAWGEKSDGILSSTDRMKMLAGLVRAQLGETLSRLALNLGAYQQQRRRIAADRVVVPESSITRMADELAAQKYGSEAWNLRRCEPAAVVDARGSGC